MKNEDSISDLIFHYCSNLTMLEILASKKLRLSDLWRSNDPGEKNYFKQCMTDICTEFELQAPKAWEQYLDNHMCLGVCFSKNCDLLSQWRGYGDMGRGIALGFSRRCLEEKICSPYLDKAKPSICEISYDKQKITNFVSNIRARRQDRSFGNKVTTTHDWIAAVSDFSYTHKHPSFHEENEFRIVKWVQKDSLPKETNYWVKRGAISPYIDITFPPEALMMVVIGPDNPTEKDLMETVLQNHDFKMLSVVQSKFSFQS